MIRTVFAAALGVSVFGAAVLAGATTAHADTDQGDWLSKSFSSSEAQPSSVGRKGRSGRTARAARSTAPSAGSYSGGGESGIASYYWQPQRVASGGMFNPNAMTAAHKTLPFGTRVRVTHVASGRSVDVVINDRGPFVRGRVIDLSRRAAQDLGMTGSGIAQVRLQVL